MSDEYQVVMVRRDKRTVLLGGGDLNRVTFSSLEKAKLKLNSWFKHEIGVLTKDYKIKFDTCSDNPRDIIEVSFRHRQVGDWNNCN